MASYNGYKIKSDHWRYDFNGETQRVEKTWVTGSITWIDARTKENAIKRLKRQGYKNIEVLEEVVKG